MSQSVTSPAAGVAAPGVSEATLPAAFQATVRDRGDRIALRAYGSEREYTWNDYARVVEEIAGGLAGLGVEPGDTVAILLPNCPDFHLTDMAVLHLGATPFSIYLTSAPGQIDYLFGNAENAVLVTEKRFLEVIARVNAPLLKHVVVIDGDADTPAEIGGAAVISMAQLRASRRVGFDFEQRWRAVGEQDLATLIYTSGTTGDPKGVELTHANLMFVMKSCHLRFPFVAEGAAISYLPTAHAADRVFSHYLATVTGWPITTVADATTVFAAVAETRPTWFLGVPRVWEKLRAGLLAKFNALPEAARTPTLAALDSALEKVRLEQGGQPVPAELGEGVAAADAAIFGPLRSQLGFDRVELLMTGAAPIPVAVHEFYLALGLPLQEGFGMSETGALGFTNLSTDIRIGKVGIAQPGTEVRIDSDGELLLRGPHVMKQYRKDPDKTAEAVDGEGWLRTGDIAEIDDEGWVSIVDRKKELIINAAGKNMSPVNIEGKLKSAHPLIGQACVIGDRRPYNVALLVLDPDASRTFAEQRGLPDSSPAALAADPELQKVIADAVAAANAQLSRVEQIKTYRLLDQEWLPDSAELTPTMKLKRRGVNDKYAAIIADLYDAPKPA